MNETLTSEEYLVTNLQTNESADHHPLRQRFWSTRVGRLVCGGLASLGIAAGTTAVDAEPVAADTSHRIAYTDGDGVWLHPDSPTVNSAVSVVLPEGSGFDIDCWKLGDSVGGNTVWQFGTGQNGAVGYITDAYLDTSWATTEDLTAQGIPSCDSNDSTGGPDMVVESLPQDIYDRSRAVEWARTHAQDRPPEEASCTFFVSNAMWAGGLDRSTEWSDRGDNGLPIPGNPNYRQGTPAAWAAPELINYLLDTYRYSTYQEIASSANAVPHAQVGDILAYDWGGDGSVDHLAFITDEASGDYPEVSEWSVNGKESAPYVDRGWTWSAIGGDWLQTRYPNMRTYLLHIDTTPVPTY